MKAHTIMEKIHLEQDISYEIRFYCDFCNEEITESEQKSHIKNCEWRKK